MNPKAIESMEFECKECKTFGYSNVCPMCRKPRPRRIVATPKWYKCEKCAYSTGPTPTCLVCGGERKEINSQPAVTSVPKWHENYISDDCKGTDQHHHCGNYHCKCPCHDVDAGIEHKPQASRFKARKLTDDEIGRLAYHCDTAIRSGLDADHIKCSGLHCPCYCHDSDNVQWPKPVAPVRHKSKKCGPIFPKHSECDDLDCQCQCHDVKADAKILAEKDKLDLNLVTCKSCNHIKATVSQGKCAECRKDECDFTFMHSSLWQCHTHKAVVWGMVKPVRCNEASRQTRVDKCTWAMKTRDEWRCIVHNAVMTGIRMPEVCSIAQKKLGTYSKGLITHTKPYKSSRCQMELEFTEGGFPTGSRESIETHKRCGDSLCECECHESGLERSTSAYSWLCSECRQRVSEPYSNNTKCRACNNKPSTDSWYCVRCRSRVSEAYNITTKCRSCRTKLMTQVEPIIASRWRCPSCQEWIEESMHSKCYQCRQKEAGNPQSDKKLIQEAAVKNLDPVEQDELFWATSRNYYAHKSPKHKAQPVDDLSLAASLSEMLECPQCDYDNRSNRTVTKCPDCENHPILTKDSRPKKAEGGASVSLMAIVAQLEEEDIFSKRIRKLREFRDQNELQFPEINPS